MYTGSAMTGRRGLGICAIGALDMALWDLVGKIEGKPCWQLLGGAAHHGRHALCLPAPGGRRPGHLYARACRARGQGQGARLQGGEARDLHQGALFAQFAADSRRPRDRPHRRRVPGGDRARSHGDGRRGLLLARLEGGATGHRDVRRRGHLLRRNAAAERRHRRLREALPGLAGEDRGWRVAEYPLRVPGVHEPRTRSTSCSRTSAGSAA